MKIPIKMLDRGLGEPIANVWIMITKSWKLKKNDDIRKFCRVWEIYWNENVHNEKTSISTIIVSRRADADKVVHILDVLTTSCKNLITMKLGVLL